jgi:release factor glutamine methyltransferase
VIETLSPVEASQQTIAGLLRTATARLTTAGSESPRLDAEVLLRHVLGIDRTELFTRLQEPVTGNVSSKFEQLVDARSEGRPVAYLIGEREFMGLTFTVCPSVLIPRPETEQLVEWALTWLERRPDADVVDVGTGSGAIVLSLATLAGDSWTGRAVGVDISREALAVAEENQARLGLDGRVEFVRGNLLEPISGPVDLILANLPYLTPVQIEENPDLAAEPRLALDGGADGLALIRVLIDDAPRVLSPNGAIAIELDPAHAHEAAKLAATRFPHAFIRIETDLSGRERLVIVECDNN